MQKTFILFFLMIISICSCEENSIPTISNEEDLKKYIVNDYLKISYNTSDLYMINCADLSFSFENVEVLKISKSDYIDISKQLLNFKLSPSQTKSDIDFAIEYRDSKFCLNHLGSLYRNGRKLQSNADFVYRIKSKTNYYNYFSEEDLIKNDSLISKNGLPFNYKPHNYEVNGKLLENDSLVVEKKGSVEKKNIILTY
ncbi:hypothetical protein [Faecalibacter rhinopitheci]|uniref:Uncharacterized protein n=1 Tax=Faecalibacter rhinopitheci TaxID=2779678 RepID=A0A8J7FSE6_9FLAO|nr:hypothetical protein [Faecalibacter rhinopitheci]MBF0596772.1 hypothetical protein [Faecalibacter rhinopitheci]